MQYDRSGISTQDLILWLGLIVVLLFILIDFFIGGYDYRTSNLFVLFNILTCVVAILGIYFNKRTNISTSINLFSIVFLFISPINEIKYGIIYWDASYNILGNYDIASLIVFIGLSIFNITYYAMSKNFRYVEYRYNKYFEVKEFNLIIISYLSLIAIMYYNNFSISSLLVRGGELSNTVDFDGTSRLIYRNIIYPLPFVCLISYILFGNRNWLIIFFLFIPFLVGNFPTGDSRARIGAMYISLLIAFFPSIIRSNIKIPAIIIIGLIVAFPTLDQFRYYSGGDIVVKILDENDMAAGHFDSFQSISGATMMNTPPGRQLLGAMLFWVPRSIWDDKPIGSGAEYAAQANLRFDNISMNFFGEGYLNFGYVGVILFSISLAVILSKIDKARVSLPLNPHLIVFSIFMIGFSFFIMRGDLMSSFAYSVGSYFSIMAVCSLGIRRSFKGP